MGTHRPVHVVEVEQIELQVDAHSLATGSSRAYPEGGSQLVIAPVANEELMMLSNSPTVLAHSSLVSMVAENRIARVGKVGS